MNKRFQKLTQKLKQVQLIGPAGKWGGKHDGYGVGVNGTSSVEQYDTTINSYEASKDSKRRGFVQCSSCTGFSGFDHCFHRRTLEALSTTTTPPSRKNSHGRSWSTGSILFFGGGKKSGDKPVGQEAGNRQRGKEGGTQLESWAHSVTRRPFDGSTGSGTNVSKEPTVPRSGCRCSKVKTERLVEGVYEKEPNPVHRGCRRCRYEPDEKWQTDDIRSHQIITVAGVCFRMENTSAKPMGGEKFLTRLRGQIRIPDPLSLLCTRPSHSTAGYLGDPEVRYRLRTAAKSKFDEMLVCGVPGPYGPEFTIRITLTPWHARASDEDIYGALG